MVITFPVSVWMCLKVIPWEVNGGLCELTNMRTHWSPLTSRIIKEYERAVVFRLGRIQAQKAKGPGMNDTAAALIRIEGT